MNQAAPSLFEVYREALCEHAHHLLAQGHARMEKSDYVDAHEPVITGDLVCEMRAFLESGDAPDWAVHYSIHDDPPVASPDRGGKHRPRVDIEFERVEIGPRPRLRFEAKRLCESTRHRVGGYLGEEGLGCFLSGKYSTTHGEAGLLGYVQSGDAETWAAGIGARLRDEEIYASVAPHLLRRASGDPLESSWTSRHLLSPGETLLTIHHVLLDFT